MDGRLRVYNVTRKRALMERGAVADGFWTRLRGLIGHRPLRDGEGLMITPCNSVHTFFMGFPIDVVYVTADGEVAGLAEELPPFRIGPIVRRARFVLELPAGTVAKTGTRVGDRIVVQRDGSQGVTAG